MVCQVVDHIELEAIALLRVPREQNGFHVEETCEGRLTLFPVMSGPGKTPFMTTASRVNPSGEMAALEMVRSVTGPMAAYARPTRAAVTREVKNESLDIVNTRRRLFGVKRIEGLRAGRSRVENTQAWSVLLESACLKYPLRALSG